MRLDSGDALVHRAGWYVEEGEAVPAVGGLVHGLEGQGVLVADAPCGGGFDEAEPTHQEHLLLVHPVLEHPGDLGGQRRGDGTLQVSSQRQRAQRGPVEHLHQDRARHRHGLAFPL